MVAKKSKELANLTVKISPDVKKFMYLDSGRLNLSLARYVEKLVEKRKKDSPPVKEYKI